MNWLSKTLKILASLLLAFVFFLALLYRSDIPEQEIIKKYSYPESHFIDLDGVNLHVRFLGEGVPIFLIHGSFSSLHTWDEWQRELSPYFMTISVDLPGHGLTGPDQLKRYTVEDYGQVILRLAEKLNLPRFHVAGNSMGGAVALQVASTRPDQVLSLNLINSSGAPRPDSRSLPTDRPVQEDNAWIFRVMESPVFSKILLKCTPRFLFSMNMKEVYGDPQRIKSESVDRYFELMLREGNREATLDRITSKKESSIDFDRLNMPTLIMWGDLDRWIPLNQALAFERGIPGSNLVVFEGVGHVPMEEIPTESVAEYLSFLGVEVRKNDLQAPNYVSYVD